MLLVVLSVALKKSRFVGDEMMVQTLRWRELLQMLKVTTIGSHAGSQVLGEVRQSLVDVFFPDGLQSDFAIHQSS